MSASQTSTEIPLPPSPDLYSSTKPSPTTPPASASPGYLTLPSSLTLLENPPPLSPEPTISVTPSPDPISAETSAQSGEEYYDLLTTTTHTKLSSILATMQAQSQLLRSMAIPTLKPEPTSQLLHPPNTHQEQEQAPLYRDPTLMSLISRMIAAKNLTRGDVGDGEERRDRELEQVRLLRGVVKELGEWDRVVLGAREEVLVGREGVLGEVEDGGEGEGEVRIVVTGPE
ncbi:MAG: hypothetical protein Q9204_004346 [Flavoplaca sp. TL-2023a]